MTMVEGRTHRYERRRHTHRHLNAKNQWVVIEVEIEIDWQRVSNDLAVKVLNNKSGRTVGLGGGLKAKLVKVEATKEN